MPFNANSDVIPIGWVESDQSSGQGLIDELRATDTWHSTAAAVAFDLEPVNTAAGRILLLTADRFTGRNKSASRLCSLGIWT